MAKRIGGFAAAAGVCLLLAAATAVPRVAHAQGGSDDPEAARARAQAAQAMASIDAACGHARQALRRARATHDARAVVCADEALTRADVSARVARDHEARAQAAWLQGDRERARFESARLAARADSARAAARDGDACTQATLPAIAAAPAPAPAPAPPPATPNDVTVVRMTVDPALPRDVAGYP
jgi:hypothetical protein